MRILISLLTKKTKVKHFIKIVHYIKYRSIQNTEEKNY